MPESLSSLKTVLDWEIKEEKSCSSEGCSRFLFLRIFLPSDSKIGRRYSLTTNAAISGVIISFDSALIGSFGASYLYSNWGFLFSALIFGTQAVSASVLASALFELLLHILVARSEALGLLGLDCTSRLLEISVSVYVICDESRTFEPFRTLVRMLGEVVGLLAWVLEMTLVL